MPQAKSLSELVDHQIRFWEERQTETKTAAPVDEQPWISISRQVGAGGTELAYVLGRHLGWKVFDRYFHDELTEAEKNAPLTFSEVDERRYAGDDLVFGMLDEPTQFVYIHKLMRVMRDSAKSSSAIFIGRGANWFLNPSSGLRVRVISSTSKRILRLIDHEGLRPEKAAECIKKSDEERRAFIRRVYNHDIDDPTGYDLLLNSDMLGTTMLMTIVLKALSVKVCSLAVAVEEKVS